MAVINATQYPICYFRYMTKQVSEHPELLSLGQDIADTAQLIAQAEKAEDNARAAAAKLSALRRQLRRAAAADPSLQKADAVGGVGEGMGLGTKMALAAAAAAVVSAAVAVVVFAVRPRG